MVNVQFTCNQLEHVSITEAEMLVVKERLLSLNDQLKAVEGDERYALAAKLYKLWCYGEEEEFEETFGPYLAARPVRTAPVMITVSSRRNQLRVWHHSYPNVYSSGHVDSFGRGVLMTVWGEPAEVRRCCELFLQVMPLSEFMNTTYGPNGPLIYVGFLSTERYPLGRGKRAW